MRPQKLLLALMRPQNMFIAMALMAARTLIFVAAVVVAPKVMAQQTQQNICYSLQRIWGDGSRHCAFTSLTKYKGAYYCTFREGFNHVFNEKGEADGVLRVIRSTDGNKWENAALIEMKGYDLRDPKLSVTPEGKLMLLFARSLYKNEQYISSTTMVAFSTDGSKFSKAKEIKVPGTRATEGSWLWRVTWHKGTGYGLSYFQENDKNVIELVSTTDGVNYKLMQHLDVADNPNECTVRFTADDRMLIFMRRDGGSRSTMLLTAAAPYTDFKQIDLGFHCGGPDAIVLTDGKVLLAGRSEYVKGHAKTSIFCGTPDGGFHEVMTLPSAADTSYPSFLQVGDEVWMTYYSTHETNKPSIFLAKIPLSYFGLARW